MAKPLELIKVAEGLILHPSRWIKGAAAKDAQGLAPYVRSDAVCWCATGAVEHAAYVLNGVDSSGTTEAIRLLNEVAKERGYENIVALNDAEETTHADVVSAFEEAKSRAEKQESFPLLSEFTFKSQPVAAPFAAPTKW